MSKYIFTSVRLLVHCIRVNSTSHLPGSFDVLYRLCDRQDVVKCRKKQGNWNCVELSSFASGKNHR